MSKKAPLYLATACALAAAIFTSSCGRGDSDTTTIKVAGSDTMLQGGLSWGDAYKKATPGVAVSVAGEGSSTGFVALIVGGWSSALLVQYGCQTYAGQTRALLARVHVRGNPCPGSYS